jgi:hypothetical protein
MFQFIIKNSSFLIIQRKEFSNDFICVQIEHYASRNAEFSAESAQLCGHSSLGGFLARIPGAVIHVSTALFFYFSCKHVAYCYLW